MMSFVESRDAESMETLLSHPLLENKIDVNVTTHTGNNNLIHSMLEVAVFNNDIKMLKILNKYGADANAPYSEDEQTVLHILAEYYCIEKAIYKKDSEELKNRMIKLILLNANPTLRDNNGKTPLDYLQNPSSSKKVEQLYLEKKGRGYAAFIDIDTPHSDLIKTLQNVAEFRDNINEICGTDATAFILHYFEQNPKKSIENCVKDLSKNLDQLMDEYIYDIRNEISNPKDNPNTSLDTAKVGGKDKSCTIM
ncbi:MAG: hypothetical protein sL5_09390 [Candidatus Mesenet longicola]|uniref:Ankyrin repeat domain-containing protein n=1 Tax=Candidatus Mesenet longicola TaxID=1892558 RepID=A0A8J3HQD6_9RICK|nr:MAG: hypothetical protein sGL2_10000 [Candidatus Mesenet longicola]GHM59946.1 MAG: hypothetical protein sL5_09390 [Candidatus Mesenet longicola]